MKKMWAATIGLAAALATGRAEDYDVTVGERSYAVKDGEKTTVTTPKGEEVPLVVSRRKIREYKGDEISFFYPSDMKVEVESDGGTTSVTVDGEGSAIVIVQVVPGQLDPGTLVKTYLDGVKESAVEMKAKVDEKGPSVCSREIGGKKRAGQKLKWTIGPLTQETEVYAFKKGDKTVGLMFQVDNEDRDGAAPGFKIIADSLK